MIINRETFNCLVHLYMTDIKKFSMLLKSLVKNILVHASVVLVHIWFGRLEMVVYWKCGDRFKKEKKKSMSWNFCCGISTSIHPFLDNLTPLYAG